MPSRPRFSEMLLGRRRQLGLTVGQASQVLKLKEQVLIAFEEGDFENIPQSGYAQGMLSSYARYLGLNPREVVDLFQEELYEHVHGTSSHELRRRTRDTQSGRGVVQGYDVVNEAESRPKAYVQYRGLLPTSGGPAGDMGAFATTSGPRPRTPSSVPLAGSSYSAGTRGQSPSYSHAEYVYGRPYNSTSDRVRNESRSREPDRYTTRQRSRYVQQQRHRVDDPANRLLREGQNGVEERRETARVYRRDSSHAQRLYERDDVSTRSVRAGEYTDDLRYDDGARPYDRASTISGRRSSRNIASVDRPNVRRRSDSQRGRLSGRSRGRVPQDNRRTILLVIVALALVLTVILVLSVRSCVNSRSTSQETKTTVPVSTTSTDSSDTTSTGSPSTPTTTTTTTTTTTDGTNTQDSSSTTAAPQQTVVNVSVASGETSWLEITNDGTSEVASTVTGPWEQSYTVTESITIRAGNPGAVTVTENGTQKSFESKASGIGSLTIQGTPAATSEDSASETSTSSDDLTSTSGTSGTSSTAGSQSSTTATTSNKTSGSTNMTKGN